MGRNFHLPQYFYTYDDSLGPERKGKTEKRWKDNEMGGDRDSELSVFSRSELVVGNVCKGKTEKFAVALVSSHRRAPHRPTVQ